MSDIAVPPGTLSSENLLSASGLATSIESLVSSIMTVQARSLILNRQQPVAPFLDASALSTRLDSLQIQSRAETRRVLDKLVPKAARSLSDASAADALVMALPDALSQPIGSIGGSNGQGKAVVQMLDAIADNFKSFRLNALELASALSKEAAAASATLTPLSALLKQEVDALDGPDGAISKSMADIARTEAAVSADIANVVKSASSIGQGCKQLITGFVATFDITPDKDGKKPAAEDGKKPAAGDAKASPAAAVRKPATASDINNAGEKSFPVEGVGAVTDGVSGMSDAIRRWQKNNTTLAGLYRDAARQNAALAIATAVLNQLDNYAASLNAAAAAALTVAADWAGITDGFNDYARQIAIDDSNDGGAFRLKRTVRDAIDHSWSRLATCATECDAVLTGRDNYFPDTKSSLS